MARSRSTSHSLARRPPSRHARSCVWIFCEGFTEKTYFDALARFFRDHGIKTVSVRCAPMGKDPLQVVRAAVEQLDRRARQGGIPSHDRVWCLVDRDEHHSLEQAIRHADRHGIDVAVSTPCFELWLLLHFQDQRAYLTTKQMERKLREHLPRYAKKVEADFPIDAHGVAIERARGPLPVGSAGDNPSTAAWRLLESIMKSRVD